MSALWSKYREDMINHAGIALFLFGNKSDGKKLLLSNGMREEYEIAKSKGLFLIPVGATGYMAEELWNEKNSEIQNCAETSDEMKKLFSDIGNSKAKSEELIESVIKIINLMDRE